MKNIELLEQVVEAALTHGANKLEGIDFHSTELRKYRDEVRKMAVRAAKEKAQLMCEELGVKVGAPMSISEQPVSWWSNGIQNQNSFQYSESAVPNSATIPLGQIPIQAMVAIQFKIEQNTNVSTSEP